MIYGIGNDICDVRRISAALQRHGERFAQRILGADEWRVYEARRARSPTRAIRYVATRFSAKEAFSKAVGLGIRTPMRWHDCQVLNQASGQPAIVLSGVLQTWFAARALKAHVTLTDETDYAVAFVVVETQPAPNTI